MLSIPLKIETFLKLIIRRKYKYLYAGVRRRFIFYFNKSYLNSQLSKRKGGCAVCLPYRKCCKMTIPWCPYLEDEKCSIYDRQPFFCKIFPIDEKDIELNDVKGLCTYYFD